MFAWAGRHRDGIGLDWSKEKRSVDVWRRSGLDDEASSGRSWAVRGGLCDQVSFSGCLSSSISMLGFDRSSGWLGCSSVSSAMGWMWRHWSEMFRCACAWCTNTSEFCCLYLR